MFTVSSVRDTLYLPGLGARREMLARRTRRYRNLALVADTFAANSSLNYDRPYFVGSAPRRLGDIDLMITDSCNKKLITAFAIFSLKISNVVFFSSNSG